jgi:hypothetical protein
MGHGQKDEVAQGPEPKLASARGVEAKSGQMNREIEVI